MPDTIIICSHRDDPFARIPKTLLDDPQLSLKAKGLLSYLVGKPKNWKMRVSDVVKRCKDGKKSVRSALRELQTCGYAKFEQPRFNGQFMEGVWKISDSPLFSPRTPFGDAVKGDAEKGYGTKKECNKSDPNKNESDFKSESKESLFGKSGCSSSNSETPRNGFGTNGRKKHTVWEDGTQEPPSSARPPIEPTWKPDSRSKEQQLKTLPIPKDYPSQREFEDFVESEIPAVASHRPDLYLTLCRNKWHQWLSKYNRWQLIRDWRQFVAALDLTMQEAAHRN